MHFRLLDFHSLYNIHSQCKKKQKKNNAFIWFFFVFLIIVFYSSLLHTAVNGDNVYKLKEEILVLKNEIIV